MGLTLPYWPIMCVGDLNGNCLYFPWVLGQNEEKQPLQKFELAISASITIILMATVSFARLKMKTVFKDILEFVFNFDFKVILLHQYVFDTVIKRSTRQ